jgi:adenosylcobinamide-GDP ribazoletransferase
MRYFVTALQFLTRIHLFKESEWSAKRFGRSVVFFPLVGMVIGIILLMINHFVGSYLSAHLTAILLVITGFIVTGALHCDGLMDTADGLLSGRSRERMLEIMKDSRVGSAGVTTFVLLVAVKWALLEDISANLLPLALVVAPVLARLVMVMAITLFPYARPEGIGKLFAQYTGRRDFVYASCLTAFLLFPLAFYSFRVFVSLFSGLLFGSLFCRYTVTKLGGLTGDVYGAATELTEIVALMAFL